MADSAPNNTISIRLDESQLSRLREALKPGEYKKAVWSAVDRTTKSGKSLVSTVLRDYLLVQKKYLDRALSAEMESNDPPIGRIRIEHQSIPLAAFKFTASKKKGVRVQMTKDRAPQFFSHAFVATVKKAGKNGEHAGHKGIFLRMKLGAAGSKDVLKHGSIPLGEVGVHTTPVNKFTRLVKATQTSTGLYAARLPIQELFGPTAYAAATMTKNFSKIMDGLRSTLAENLEKRVKSQISRFAGK